MPQYNDIEERKAANWGLVRSRYAPPNIKSPPIVVLGAVGARPAVKRMRSDLHFIFVPLCTHRKAGVRIQDIIIPRPTRGDKKKTNVESGIYLCEIWSKIKLKINRTRSHLEVVLLDHHLEVKPRELAQVSVRPRLLRSEHRSHLPPHDRAAPPSQHKPRPKY